jgi:3-oxoacyl-[acyl-carrier protein] reductase
LLTRALVPAMRREGKGRIVFVGSISSTLGTARQAAYVASKWGVVGFMKSLAEELKDTGVVTLAVLPGSTSTRMLEGSGFEPRMTAEDVAKTIVHFALDAPAAHAGAAIEMFGV